MQDLITIELTINSIKKKISFNPDSTLLSVLRENGYTEVHNGCETGDCGACVVILNGKTVNSCMVLAATARNGNVMTVRALGDVHNPHPIQRAFADSGAVQCGFCTPGQVLSTYSLLSETPDPSETEIKDALDGNLCRCTGYKKIIEAVELAAEYIREASDE